MKQRLMILRVSPDPDPGGFPALGGTRGQSGQGDEALRKYESR